MVIQKLTIRRASHRDADLIAELGMRTFKASFRADNRPEDMEQYLSLNFSKAHIEAQLADPESIFFLACENGREIGYVMLRTGETPDSVPGTKPVELVRIYIEEIIIGKGYGSAIMQSCLEAAKRVGHRTIWLGVWEKNLRAIRFYEKWGFKKVGTQKFVLG
ncbi:MAG: GNAT family N-acetyltransferase, partial [Deltaproteobacteria bacterium]|nr:GNAT family N-acetyltransferase [Deltaproteobacteria bacterium]